MMSRRCVFNEAFKAMAVELSNAKGSVQEAACELGVDAGRISKWRQHHKKPNPPTSVATGLTDEQKQIG